MSSLFSFYRRGIVSLVLGPILVVVGLATGMHLMALGGLVAMVWGGYRCFAARGAGR